MLGVFNYCFKRFKFNHLLDSNLHLEHFSLPELME